MTATSGTALDRNHRDYAILVRGMQSALARRRWSEAAARAQQIGAFAWLNHTGLFASQELESAMRELRGGLAGAPSWRGEPVDVLHVVTQTYATGGPTQAIAQWVDRDRARRHHVCLTQQGAAPLPAKLLRSTRGGRDLSDLTTVQGGLLDRASTLRALVAQADLVVVHSHPHDVVPTLAVPADRTRVLSINHADHVFWAGTSVPGLHVSMRESGRVLSTTRRGIDPALTAVLARPLSMPTRQYARAEARRRLGVPPDARVVVTAADAAKYRPVDGPSLLEMVLPVVEADPRNYLLAAGPGASGEWLRAQELTDGRVRALGRLPDVTELHHAADVYLDSFPFASLTSLLEAASLGTPVISFDGHPPGCAVLGADTPGVDDDIRRPRSAEGLRRDLEELLDDGDRRLDEGERLARAVASAHDGPNWLASLESVYARARLASPSSGGAVEPVRCVGELDRLVARVQANTPLVPGLGGAARFALPYFPPKVRLSAWATVGLAGSPVSPALLLSPSRLASFVQWRRSVGLTRRSLHRLVPRRQTAC